MTRANLASKGWMREEKSWPGWLRRISYALGAMAKEVRTNGTSLKQSYYLLEEFEKRRVQFCGEFDHSCRWIQLDEHLDPGKGHADVDEHVCDFHHQIAAVFGHLDTELAVLTWNFPEEILQSE